MFLYSPDFFEPLLGKFSVLEATKQIYVEEWFLYRSVSQIVIQCIMHGFLVDGHIILLQQFEISSSHIKNHRQARVYLGFCSRWGKCIYVAANFKGGKSPYNIQGGPISLGEAPPQSVSVRESWVADHHGMQIAPYLTNITFSVHTICDCPQENHA